MEKFPVFDRPLEDDEVDLGQNDDYVATLDPVHGWIPFQPTNPTGFHLREKDLKRICETFDACHKNAIPLNLEKLSLDSNSECPCGGNHERVEMIYSAFCKKCDRTLT